MNLSPFVYYPGTRFQNLTPLVCRTAAIAELLILSCEEVGYNVSLLSARNVEIRVAVIGKINERLIPSGI